MLKRTAISRFENWKSNKTQQGLLVTGARQVGKTYLIREFAKAHYKHFIEINLLENALAKDALQAAKNAKELFARLTIFSEDQIVPGETLFFIDEVQEHKEIVTAVKFLVEQNDVDFILSGSLLGVELRDVKSVPVGYLDVVEMFPLSFQEYAAARGFSGGAGEIVKDSFRSRTELPDYVHDAMLSLFHEYLIVGGMPAAVASFTEANDLQAVRRIQENIVALNKWDISKYRPDDALLIKNMYELIPAELNQQNKRFILKSMNERARFSQYADSLVWLTAAGVAIPVY
ncbi:MAG: AAA family ATPase, partial [Clostridiales Family XIII bacterium]|nr:AAA family ATPase [Clostridiales Family XIII bacterium]